MASKGSGDLTRFPGPKLRSKEPPSVASFLTPMAWPQSRRPGRPSREDVSRRSPWGGYTSASLAREKAGQPPARLRLWVFDGASPLTDIGALQVLIRTRLPVPGGVTV